jgi:hypothetical protein
LLEAEVTYAEVMQGRLRDPVFRELRVSDHKAVRGPRTCEGGSGLTHKATWLRISIPEALDRVSGGSQAT